METSLVTVPISSDHKRQLWKPKKSLNEEAIFPIKPKTAYRTSRKHRSRGLNNSYDASSLRKMTSQQLPTLETKSSFFSDDKELYKSFGGAYFLKLALDSQLSRKSMKSIAKSIKHENIDKLRAILFETLSFFVSLRNVAFQNCENVFLPRVLEMIADIFEVERVTVFVYDEENSQFYCKAINTEITNQIVLQKDFGHFAFGLEKPFYINDTSDDHRFD